MNILNTLSLKSNRQIKINFDGGDLSLDTGLLLIKGFVSKLGIDKLLNTHSRQMLLQHLDFTLIRIIFLHMIYMIIAGENLKTMLQMNL